MIRLSFVFFTLCTANTISFNRIILITRPWSSPACRALDFDIGVYFEANGHGTIIFDPAAEARIRGADNDAAKKLANLIDVINQTVGDAISDMLVVETILHARGWSVQGRKEKQAKSGSIRSPSGACYCSLLAVNRESGSRDTLYIENGFKTFSGGVYEWSSSPLRLS